MSFKVISSYLSISTPVGRQPLNGVYESSPQQEGIASFEIQIDDINNNEALCCILGCIFNISTIHFYKVGAVGRWRGEGENKEEEDLPRSV